VPKGLEADVPLRETGAIGLNADVSHDGHRLAVGGADGIARLYDLASGRVIASMQGTNGTALECIQFSADGSRLVGSDLDGDVFVWDVASGRQLATTIHTVPGIDRAAQGFTRVSFGADNRIVTATQSGEVTVWDITDPADPTVIGGPYAGSLFVSVAAFAPHTFLAPGSDLLAFDDAGHTDVWNIRTRTRPYPPLQGGTVGESIDGSTLVTAAGSQGLLWDMATGQRRGQPVQGVAAQIYGTPVLFSRDGQRAAIATAGTTTSDATVTVVDLASGDRVGNPIPGTEVRYLDDGRVVVAAGPTIELWRPGAGATVPFATVLAAVPSPMAHWLSPTTVYGLLGTASLSGAFMWAGPAPRWDASTGAAVGDLFGPQDPLGHAAIGGDSIVNPAGTLAAVGQGDTIVVWDLSHRRRVAVLNPGQRQPLATWDPVAPILATTGLGGTLALWDVSDPGHITLLGRTTVPGYTNNLAAGPSEPMAHFSPDGHTIAAVSNAFGPPVTSLVSVPQARVVRVLKGDGFGHLAAFTADSKTVATIQDSFTLTGRVVLWDVATGSQRTLSVPYPQLASVAFANGDRWLVTVQSAAIRDVPLDQVTSRVDLWDAATLQPIGEPIIVRGDAVPVEIDRPGGSRLLSGTSTQTGADMIWDLDPAHWASIACSIAGRNLTQWPAGA